MNRAPEPADLLEQYAAEKRQSVRIRNTILTVLAASMLGLLIYAAVTRGSENVLLGFFGTVGVVFGITIALAYAGFVFFMAWTYATWVQDKGQTRVSALQLLTIILLGCFITAFFGLGEVRKPELLPFWILLGAFAWTNVLAGSLGYCAEFWARKQHKDRENR